MIAIGAGGLDVAVCMAGPPLRAAVPQDRRRLPRERAAAALDPGEGRHPRAPAPARSARWPGRDLRVHRAGRGDAVSYTERGTIANMIAELGATGAVFPADDETKRWFDEQERAEDFVGAEPPATRRTTSTRSRRSTSRRSSRSSPSRRARATSSRSTSSWARLWRRSASARRSTRPTRTWRSAARCSAATGSPRS